MRVEEKYVISLGQAEQLLTYLSSRTSMDKNTPEEQDYYEVLSLYYDTPSFFCVTSAKEGNAFRKKFRIRTYPGKNEKYYLESKVKHVDTSIKYRTELIGQDFKSCSNELMKLSDQGIINNDFLFHYKKDHLKPKGFVRYKRTALVLGDYLRITLDRNLEISAPGQNLSKPQNYIKTYISDINRQVVLEVKYSRKVYWLDQILRKISQQRQSFSKYILSHGILYGRNG